MRLPLAPSKPPATDAVGPGSTFGVIHMLRQGTSNKTPYQRVGNEVAREQKWKDPSLLVENMVGAFSQRCDRLLDDLRTATAAVALFGPEWMITVYHAGVRNEQWLKWWAGMRRNG